MQVRHVIPLSVAVCIVIAACTSQHTPEHNTNTLPPSSASTQHVPSHHPSSTPTSSVSPPDSDTTTLSPPTTSSSLTTQHAPKHTVQPKRNEKKRVALTFDDGPWSNTRDILRILAHHHIHATFCVVGKHAQSRPDVVQHIVDQGHQLCNHSYAHDEDLNDRSVSTIKKDIHHNNVILEHIVGEEHQPTLFRSPGGDFQQHSNTAQAVHELNMQSLQWSIDSKDWSRPGNLRIRRNVVADVQPGSIVLLHDGGGDRSQTVTALPKIIRWLKNHDYHFVQP